MVANNQSSTYTFIFGQLFAGINVMTEDLGPVCIGVGELDVPIEKRRDRPFWSE